MNDLHVRIIYNEDGTDEYLLEGERVEFDAHSKTVAEIEECLRSVGYATSVTPLMDSEDHVGSLDNFIGALKGFDGAMVFNLCEAAFDSSAYEMHVASLLELYGLAFTGSGPVALALSLDKGMSKAVLNSRGIRTPAYAVFDSEDDPIPESLSFPLIVKPLSEDASVGIDSGSVVHSVTEFKERATQLINTYLQPVIAEEYIEGREINVAVIGNGETKRALPPSEISFVDFPADVPKICCYEAKWVTDSPLYTKTVPVCPAELTDRLATELKSVALSAYEALGCLDYARIDTRVGADGRVYVIEVNPNPDISSDAGFARAAKAAGLDYAAFVAEIVNVALERYAEEEGDEEVPEAGVAASVDANDPADTGKGEAEAEVVGGARTGELPDRPVQGG